MILSDRDRIFLENNITDIDKLILQGKVRQILDAIGDCIDRKGFAPPDYYDYNEFGREAQKVYDRIYENNCILLKEYSTQSVLFLYLC